MIDSMIFVSGSAMKYRKIDQIKFQVNKKKKKKIKNCSYLAMKPDHFRFLLGKFPDYVEAY